MMKLIGVFLAVVLLGVVGVILRHSESTLDPNALSQLIRSFDDCVQAGYEVSASYPRKCELPDGTEFIEPITDSDTMHQVVAEAIDSGDEIVVLSPTTFDTPHPDIHAGQIQNVFQLGPATFLGINERSVLNPLPDVPADVSIIFNGLAISLDRGETWGEFFKVMNPLIISDDESSYTLNPYNVIGMFVHDGKLMVDLAGQGLDGETRSVRRIESSDGGATWEVADCFVLNPTAYEQAVVIGQATDFSSVVNLEHSGYCAFPSRY